MSESMQGKTVLLTGASSGIGKSTALELARLGATVVMVCRDPKKAEATVAEIRAAVPDPKLEVLYADLSSMAEVRKLAAEFRAKHQRLDVLLNNAGAILMERVVTVDGLEKTFATNHLAYFLLTNLLLDLLKASAPSRIINVSSEAHRSAHLHFDDLQSEKRFTGFQAYGLSKLMNILFTRELAHRLEGTGVTVNALHPGVVSTGFGQGEHTGLLKYAMKIAKPFFISTEKGARTSVYLASAPEVATTTGEYFAKCKPKETTRQAQNMDLARRLWDASAKLAAI
jgi:NAD(P)-dependent dehydrogenase (short-subunit alcohol dehydrogenase family)